MKHFRNSQGNRTIGCPNWMANGDSGLVCKHTEDAHFLSDPEKACIVGDCRCGGGAFHVQTIVGAHGLLVLRQLADIPQTPVTLLAPVPTLIAPPLTAIKKRVATKRTSKKSAKKSTPKRKASLVRKRAAVRPAKKLAKPVAKRVAKTTKKTTKKATKKVKKSVTKTRSKGR